MIYTYSGPHNKVKGSVGEGRKQREGKGKEKRRRERRREGEKGGVVQF